MLNSEGFIVAKSQRVVSTRATALARTLKPVSFYTETELACVPTGSIFVFDAEVYRNFFYVAFKNVETGKVIAFEQSPGASLNVGLLRWMLWRFLLVGFNSQDYDLPIITYAMTGATCDQIKEASDYIILAKDELGRKRRVTNFEFEKQFRVKIGNYNHVDLIEVAPLEGSLKLYSGRLHCPRMQDLPFDPSHILTEEEAGIVRPYCCNDLDNTALLAWELWPAIELRADMSRTYGVELRSKSDAQVAEAVINTELKKLTGEWPQKVKLRDGMTLQYNAPSYIQFKSPELQKALHDISNAVFHLDGLGSPVWPKGLGVEEKSASGKSVWTLCVTVAGTVYKLGMGGLHSQEKSVSHIATGDIILADNDVESFYPRIILNQKLFPSHLGPAFLAVYEMLVNRRLDAKARAAACKEAGDKKGEKHWKQIADSLKITINGSFGKLGNKYSTLYAPQLMLQVTISGQLSLLMLIEMLEEAGIRIIQGNTDGVVCKYTKAEHERCRAVIAEWERLTCFKTEETRYGGVYSRDVNNYIATKLDKEGKIVEMKTKGVYCERGSAGNSVLSKNPETLICSDAVQAFIKDGTPIHETITKSRDIRRFIAIKNVKGGGEKGGHYLGKVVRFYYPKNEPGFIAYVGSGNKVAKTDGARPLMDLPEEFPQDIDYSWYIKEASDMLYDIGLFKRAQTGSLFS